MGKLPVLRSGDLIKILKKMGFYEYHRVGSHAQFKHFDGRRTTISIHSGRDIPRGTLGAILEDLKISKKELIRLLNK